MKFTIYGIPIRQCSCCKEYIKDYERTCRYCGNDLNQPNISHEGLESAKIMDIKKVAEYNHTFCFRNS